MIRIKCISLIITFLLLNPRQELTQTTLKTHQRRPSTPSWTLLRHLRGSIWPSRPTIRPSIQIIYHQIVPQTSLTHFNHHSSQTTKIAKRMENNTSWSISRLWNPRPRSRLSSQSFSRTWTSTKPTKYRNLFPKTIWQVQICQWEPKR